MTIVKARKSITNNIIYILVTIRSAPVSQASRYILYSNISPSNSVHKAGSKALSRQQSKVLEVVKMGA